MCMYAIGELTTHQNALKAEVAALSARTAKEQKCSETITKREKRLEIVVKAMEQQVVSFHKASSEIMLHMLKDVEDHHPRQG